MCDAVCALVTTNISAGIVSCSYALYHMGLFAGLIIVLILGILSHLVNILYLKVKDLTPRKYESMYEIAYLLYGRVAIFIVCTNNLAGGLAFTIFVYICVGESAQTLIN